MTGDPMDLKNMFAQRFRAASQQVYGVKDIYETTDDEEAPNIIRYMVELTNGRRIEFIIQEA